MSRIHDVLIVGGGAAGIATAASLKKRQPGLDIGIIDPADVHYYQPGWTLVGGGVFTPEQTARDMDTLIPSGIRRIKASVVAFEPESNAVVTDSQRCSLSDVPNASMAFSIISANTCPRALLLATT